MVWRRLMKILFITHPYPNYVPDLLLHGLRKLMGPRVVDYPRKDCVYDGILGLGICPNDQRCPDWFPHDNGQIDRTDIWSKVENDYFELVVCDVRALTKLSDRLKTWPKHVVIIDGEDLPQPLSPGPYIICRRETDGSDYSIPLPMALPEEIFNWIIRYDGLPKSFSIGFLGSTHNDNRKQLIETLSHIYSDTLFCATKIPSPDDPKPDGRLSRDRYYQQLQRCRIVLSLGGAGWDTFRFWEHAACHAAHIANRAPLYIPNDFINNQEIIRFGGMDELRRKIDALIKDDQLMRDQMNEGRGKLLRHHLTTHRAVYFIDRVAKAFDN